MGKVKELWQDKQEELWQRAVDNIWNMPENEEGDDLDKAIYEEFIKLGGDKNYAK